MSSYLLKLKLPLLLALAFVCLHGVFLLAFPAHATPLTYPFIIVAPVLALAACCWRAFETSRPSRLPWILFSAGLSLWIIGMLLSAWEELFQHISATVAFFSDFVFFLYGVPVLLAISSPAQKQRIPLFVWLDGTQAILTGYLTYITLFAVVPFTTGSLHPISVSLLLLVYNAQNLVLACAATLRVIAQREQEEDRQFFRTLCAFLWTYAICAGIYNYVSSLRNDHSTIDLLVDIPFLLFTIMALRPFTQKEDTHHTPNKNSITLFIDNVSPIFYTLALLALGLTVIRSHFTIGITAIVVALAVYGTRTTLLQIRYMQSQQALQQALARLEEISLTDGLTSVPNRRCFDQVLETEWNRAVRNRQSISLLMIDIDCFKNLNDNYGHRHGDACLVEISGVLQATLTRGGDLLARYGGEEFAALLPATKLNGAMSIAEAMRIAVLSLHIENETPIGDFVTISIGVAVQELPQDISPVALLEASDRALYLAKQNGRNRIEASSPHTLAENG